MTPVVAEIYKNRSYIPRKWRIPWQIDYSKVVVDVKIGSVFHSSTQNANEETSHRHGHVMAGL